MDSINFSIATNFDNGLVDALSGYPVTELFGKLTSDPMGGGRASHTTGNVDLPRLRSHAQYVRSKGIRFNYLLNAACLDNMEFSRSGQKKIERTLEMVEDCGIESVTVSMPFLLQMIKKRHPGLKVRVGVYARVDSPAKAIFWQDMGADTITLESISINRDFDALHGIRRAVSLELQLIANSNCMVFCPLSGAHMVNLAHASQSGHSSHGFIIDYCALKCSYQKLKEPVNYLRSEFIRPEDLKIYTDMGYRSFKILERGAPTGVMLNRVKAYSEGRFDGNLLDLIQPYGYKQKRESEGLLHFIRYFFRPGNVKLSGMLKLKELADARGLTAMLEGEPVYINNRALDGFIDGFRGRSCRTSGCQDCGYCGAYAKKAVRVDDDYRNRLLKLYESCFDEVVTGRLWGIKPK